MSSVENDEHDWLTAVFGMEQGGPQVQNVGAVVCNEGRLLTFPNTLQHRVGRFSLKDKSKPGRRKILALFLVDPKIRVTSTSNVPPQRRDWFAEEMYEARAFGEKLPVELQEQIINDLDFMDMEDAKELRVELMDEWRTFGRSRRRCLSRRLGRCASIEGGNMCHRTASFSAVPLALLSVNK